MADLQRFERPESEDDIKYMVRFAHHGCRQFNEGVARLGREAMAGKNLILFPIGIFGQGMPLGIPFEVWTTEPCEACKQHVSIWVEWTGPKVFDLGAGS